MVWDIELYNTLDNAGIEAWPDFAGDGANEQGHLVWRVIDDLYTDYLDVQGFANVIVNLDFRSNTRAGTQALTRTGINAIWRRGLLLTIDKCDWYYDFQSGLHGTEVSAVLQTEIEFIEGDKGLRANCSDYYGEDMVWDTELVKAFRKVKIEAYPDFAPGNPDLNKGHVVWRQSDELVEDYLDTPGTSQIEIELDFRAYTRARVQSMMRTVIDRLERSGQLIRAESARWYFDETASANRNQPIKGSVITAILFPDPGIQPEGEFNSDFNADFDVLQGA